MRSKWLAFVALAFATPAHAEEDGPVSTGEVSLETDGQQRTDNSFRLVQHGPWPFYRRLAALPVEPMAVAPQATRRPRWE